MCSDPGVVEVGSVVGVRSAAVPGPVPLEVSVPGKGVVPVSVEEGVSFPPSVEDSSSLSLFWA